MTRFPRCVSRPAIAAILALTAATVSADEMSGRWQGHITNDRGEHIIAEVTLEQTGTEFSGAISMFGSPEIPLCAGVFDSGRVQFKLDQQWDDGDSCADLQEETAIVFEGQYTGSTLTGTASDGEINGTWLLIKAVAVASDETSDTENSALVTSSEPDSPESVDVADSSDTAPIVADSGSENHSGPDETETGLTGQESTDASGEGQTAPVPTISPDETMDADSDSTSQADVATNMKDGSPDDAALDPNSDDSGMSSDGPPQDDSEASLADPPDSTETASDHEDPDSENESADQGRVTAALVDTSDEPDPPAVPSPGLTARSYIAAVRGEDPEAFVSIWNEKDRTNEPQILREIFRRSKPTLLEIATNLESTMERSAFKLVEKDQATLGYPCPSSVTDWSCAFTLVLEDGQWFIEDLD